MKKYFITINLIMALALLSCSPSSQTESAPQALPYYHTADFTPLWLNAQDPALDTLHRIGEFRLVDQLGDTLTQANFRDKIYVTNFFFTTCPGICPKMTSSLSMVQDAFLNDDDILLLSHSVTPKTDSVPVLKAYGERKRIDAKKWHLVTGYQQEIYHLGRKVYFVEEDLGLQKSDDAFLHTENLVLIDKKQHIRGIYNGLNKASITQLIADIRTLQQEH